MDIHLESSAMDVALESGWRHVTLTFGGAGVVFAANGLPVTVERWQVVLGLDEQEVLQDVGLTLDGLDAGAVEALAAAVSLPTAATSDAGAERVRLRLKAAALTGVVRPAMATIAGPADLLELQDAEGQPLFFDLTHFELQDLTPRVPAA